MDPLTISAGITILEAIIKNEPAIAADIQALFSKGVPTAADFDALRASVAQQTYGSFVPASALPPS